MMRRLRRHIVPGLVALAMTALFALAQDKVVVASKIDTEGVAGQHHPAGVGKSRHPGREQGSAQADKDRAYGAACRRG
jgi:hypothetical protein